MPYYSNSAGKEIGFCGTKRWHRHPALPCLSLSLRAAGLRVREGWRMWACLAASPKGSTAAFSRAASGTCSTILPHYPVPAQSTPKSSPTVRFSLKIRVLVFFSY